AWVDEPSPYLAAAGWAAGEPPLWTPAEGLGAPLAANLNSGAGNPLQLPLVLWPSARAADLFALARILVLALGTAAFLAELGLTPVAALAGAAIAGYGSYALAWIVHHPLSAELYAPLMLAGVERGRRGAAGGWLVVALACAGSCLGGKLQATLLCVALLSVYGAVRAPRGSGGAGRATLVAAAVAGALGLGLAAYLMLPAAELMRRASGLALGGRSALAGLTLPWPTLAAVAVPRAFIPPERAFADGLPLPPAVGLVATVLAVVGASASRSPLHGLARLFACVAAIVLARNAGLFGHDWMTRVPVVRGVFFLKYTFVAAFALAVLAAIGVDAVARGLVPRATWRRALGVTLVGLVVLLAAAARRGLLIVWPDGLAPSAAALGCLALALALAWRRAAGSVAALLLLGAVVLELRALAPVQHPPRVEPYRPPPYVEFLRAAPAGRVLADGSLMPPLTSAAAGLRDVRAIDVLTPGTTYAFFTRLVSFCARIIHFTVDPDLPVAATAPAADLAAVRWVVSRGALAFDDLDARVGRQSGRARLARLLSGLRAIRTRDSALALGPVESAGENRYALSLVTPFTLELEAESEAAELVWDVHAEGDGARISWRVETEASEGGPADGPPVDGMLVTDAVPGWRETRLALGPDGVPRRTRLRVEGRSLGPGRRARVDLGDLGFSDGQRVEAARREAARASHRAERAELVQVFRDDQTGATVYENRNALPRAFRVGTIEAVPSVEAALARLDGGFEFRRAALVEESAAARAASERAAALAARPSGAAAGGASAWRARTLLVKDDPEAVTVATDGDAAGLLVVADLAYPGWRATIDGLPAPIVTTDALLRGVRVPRGAHCVELRYAPASWLWGLVVTGLALLLAPGAARRAARAHRKIVPPFAAML
ncbi:MAG TPA: hypothetical protein VGK30_07300, partial [Candidatus Binatia bacterium]